MNVLFSGHTRDTDNIVLSYIENPIDLMHLSAVNKEANTFVTNDLFFKNCFTQQYPHLASNDKIFRKLCVYFPTICWKVACCVLAHGRIPDEKYVEGDLDEVANRVKNRLHVLKPEICDPKDIDSKIEELQQTSEQCRLTFDAYRSKLNKAVFNGENTLGAELRTAVQKLRRTHNNIEEMQIIFNWIRIFGTDLLFVKEASQLEEQELTQRVAFFDEKLTIHFHQQLIPDYLVLGNSIQHWIKLGHESFSQQKQCAQIQRVLEEFRTLHDLDHSLQDAKHKKDSIEIICEDLLIEKDEVISKECSMKIEWLKNIPVEGSLFKEVKERIYSLVNFHSQSELIWNSLYNYHGNNTQEAQWAKNHFHEYLEDLDVLLIDPSKWELVLEHQQYNEEAFVDFIFYLKEVLGRRSSDSLEMTREKILDFVNSFVGGNKIWEVFYKRYADNSPEENWAKNHILEFLPELYETIQSLNFAPQKLP